MSTTITRFDSGALGLVATTQGPRTRLEDAAAVNESGLVICDGMGGERNGREGAQAAVGAVLPRLAQDDFGPIFDAAHDAVVQSGGHTTCSFLSVRRGTTHLLIHWAHIGDTSLWMLTPRRQGVCLRRFTTSHTLWQQRRDSGTPFPDNRCKNILQRYLGSRPMVWDAGAEPYPVSTMPRHRPPVWLLGMSDGLLDAWDRPDGTSDLDALTRALMSALPHTRSQAAHNLLARLVERAAEKTNDNATLAALYLPGGV